MAAPLALALDLPQAMHPVVAAALGAAMVRLVWAPAVQALPEPGVHVAGARDKLPYRQLGRGQARVAAVATALAVATVWWWVPLGARPVWMGLATVGVMLAVVDLYTTWLPLPLTHALWGLTLLGLIALPFTAGPREALVSATAALATTAFFWAMWRCTGGLGFGDVRLAPVIGAAAGSMSPTHAFAAVLLGTLLGAVHGIAHRLLGRQGPFPYGPALVAGPLLALLLTPGPI